MIILTTQITRCTQLCYIGKHESGFNQHPKMNSTRHHYVPQFFLEGFKNSDGLLYIYDKDKNRILKNPRPPKAIFFERDRNTIELTETIRSSIIEDKFYSKIDSDTSRVVKHFQTEKLEKIDFNFDNTAQFQFFLITLFWRIPYTDFAAEYLMKQAEITSPGIDPELLRNDPNFKKIKRAFLAKHHINDIVKYGMKGKISVNIHQAPNELFIIGDNPLLFKKTPSIFSEFTTSDFLIAVSSNRIYSSTNQVFENTTLKNWANYNAAVISQSTRYVACGDIEFLQRSVRFYNELKENGLDHSLAEDAFKTN